MIQMIDIWETVWHCKIDIQFETTLLSKPSWCNFIYYPADHLISALFVTSASPRSFVLVIRRSITAGGGKEGRKGQKKEKEAANSAPTHLYSSNSHPFPTAITGYLLRKSACTRLFQGCENFLPWVFWVVPSKAVTPFSRSLHYENKDFTLLKGTNHSTKNRTHGSATRVVI